MTINPIYSHIVGRDTEPTPVNEVLTDWFAQWLHQNPPSARPTTLRGILTNVLPRQTWVPFALGDGTFLQYSEENKDINRHLRFTIVSTPESPSNPPAGFPRDAPIGDVNDVVRRAFRGVHTICVVGSAMFDDPEAFLQVASWDAIKRRINFYQRERASAGYGTPDPAYDIDTPNPTIGRWLYLGSSCDAFTPDTEGQGPFCGHVNGTLVMKELTIPWTHWHSTRHTINRTFSPRDPIFDEDLLQPPGSRQLSYIALGDRFETIVRNATSAWYNSRREQDFGPNGSPHPTATNLVSWMRHVLTTTTVNIAGSSVNSEVVIHEGSNARIPHGFFFNDRVIKDMLPYDIEIPRLGDVSSAHYNAARIKMGLKTIYRDCFWNPWCVLVPSLEDMQGINRIIAAGLMSEPEVLAFLMIDFPNPIYSRRREQLLQYVPQTCSLVPGAGGRGTYSLIDSIQASILASPAGRDMSSPEAEFLNNLSQSRTSMSEFKQACEVRIAAYMTKVAAKLATSSGVEDYMLLAESRRRFFRPYPSSQGPSTNPLSEFSMTLPYATALDKDWGFMEMTEEGEVRVLGVDGQNYLKGKIAERFKQTPKQCHTVAGGEAHCPN